MERAPCQAFPPDRRLHSNRDYGRVFHRQQKAAGRHVVVLLHPRHRRAPPQARLGVMISAKAVKTAVRRHQLKRWVRELFRLRLAASLPAVDLVVMFRCDPQGEDAHPRLDDEILSLLPRALAAQPKPGRR